MAKLKEEKLDHFQVLRIKVTDSAADIKARWDEISEAVLNAQNFGHTKDERDTAKRIGDVKNELLKDDRLREVIAKLFERALDPVKAVLAMNEGKKVAGPVYKGLLDIVTNQYHFQPALADRLLKQYLRDQGMNPEDPKVTVVASGAAQLVDGLVAQPGHQTALYRSRSRCRTGSS